MTRYQAVKNNLISIPKTWLVTGAAGFIGSNLIEQLLKMDQEVVGLDNFSTGKQSNLDEVKTVVSNEQWRRFRFVSGDIRSLQDCHQVCDGIDFVLHQAALGSVPRSIDNPINTNENNITGTLNMLVAARDARVSRFVYASSSSVYGDHPALPKVEENNGRQLSPYAVTKYVSELYADQFANHYGLEIVGLRYFNVFGPRQDPEGAYAAVIPKWIAAQIKGEPVFINGTGETSRDFCFIDNVIQMNILAAVSNNPDAKNQVYNVALNERTNLNQLFEMLRSRLSAEFVHLLDSKPVYRAFRTGDVLHSQADIHKAKYLLGYVPSHSIEQGLDQALEWYKKNLVVKSDSSKG